MFNISLLSLVRIRKKVGGAVYETELAFEFGFLGSCEEPGAVTKLSKVT